MRGYDKEFLVENMMGPNPVKILEEMAESVPFREGMRILDLGCGRGLTSIFLAREFGAEVYAVDLWTNPTDNYRRFQEQKVADRIVPLCFDASRMPFADGYFDAVVSVDAYHYFGNTETYFGDCVAPLLKKEGLVAIAFPSIRQDFTFESIPEEMRPFWEEEAFYMWRSTNWWTRIFRKHLTGMEVKELGCFEEAWGDWLALDNEYAVADRDMMKADGGKYMNILSITGKVRQLV